MQEFILWFYLSACSIIRLQYKNNNSLNICMYSTSSVVHKFFPFISSVFISCSLFEWEWVGEGGREGGSG